MDEKGFRRFLKRRQRVDGTVRSYVGAVKGFEGKTPAEACVIAVEGKNKWITLIQNASILNS